jgi:protein-S-isoprenylcysteine O-methyltransferase Ste14
MIASVVLLYDKHLKADWLSIQLLPQNDITGVLGVLVAIMGLACCVWARRTLGRNWSGRVTLKVDHELIRTGPYAFVRHPIYTGFFLMVLGPVIILGKVGGILSLALCLFAVWQKSNIEEDLMMETFPNDYAEYKRHTKRLIPFIW